MWSIQVPLGELTLGDVAEVRWIDVRDEEPSRVGVVGDWIAVLTW